MRAIFLLVVLSLLAPLVSAGQAPTPVPLAHDAASELLRLATGEGDMLEALLWQLAHQDGRSYEMSAAARLPPAPPDVVFRDARPACDLDGDGVGDLLVNNLTLTAPPSHARAHSEIEALSGATGARLWKVDNLFYASLPAPASVPYGARGQALPELSDNARPVFDLDGDGACDVIAYGLDDLPGLSSPFLGEPSISRYLFALRALSGRTGDELWNLAFTAESTSASDPIYGASANVVTRNFPTGVLTFDDAGQPRVVVKVTDIRYHLADSPFSFGIPEVFPGSALMEGQPHAEDVRITERVQLRDARSGALLWERTLGSESPDAGTEERSTNITWLAGVAPLGGGSEVDILLDQMTITTPRSNEANHPVTGDTLFRYGRGVRVTALDGKEGATLWTSVVLDPLAARPNIDAEENFESLAWTRSAVFPDLDRDGTADVMVTYVAQEETSAATIAGAFRTHLVPLSGANGTAMWDVRQQGWGVAKALDKPATRIGLGMLDVPTLPREGGRFPPKLVRLMSLDSATGEALWTYEKSFAQNSYLSYNLGLAQFGDTLAPRDIDGDGILDMVTPAQEAPRTGRDQVLLATSSHSYGILSGADGHELSRLRAWGPDGRAVACEGSEGDLAVVSGHARRIEFARFDAGTGDRIARAVLHNDPTPRAATSAIDLTALAATCAQRATGTLFAVDLQAFSFARGHEVIPAVGLLAADGGALWRAPALRGAPPSDALFQASLDVAEPTTGALLSAAAAAVVVGGAAALGTILLLRRMGSRLLAVGIVLLLVAPGTLALGIGAPHALDPTPAQVFAASGASPSVVPARLNVPSVGAALDPAVAPGRGTDDEGASGSSLSPATLVASARALVLGSAFENETLSRFEDDDTITFTYSIGDVDHDGHDDMALDQYCVDWDACVHGTNLFDEPVAWATMDRCGEYGHDIVVVSGRNGSIIWSMDIDVLGPLFSCGEHFVIGTFPIANGSGILLYRYQVVYVPARAQNVIFHDLIALDAADGMTLWTWKETGEVASDTVTHSAARNYVINPRLQVAQVSSTGILGPTIPSLFLSSVGWITSTAGTVFPVAPGYELTNSQVQLWDVDQPQEWAASVDLSTGAELWRHDTFTPAEDATRNVLPLLVDFDYGDEVFGASWLASRIYWNDRPCCFDLTGDGQPDLVYRVFEWTPLSNAKVAGPAALDVRLVAFDGATGAKHLDTYVATDVVVPRRDEFDMRHNYIFGNAARDFAFELVYEAIGDVDGDGAQDLLQHQVRLGPDFSQTLSVISGKTGGVLWTVDSVRDLRALVVGDADGDGGNDFLLVDWYGHEAGRAKADDFVTPAAIPLTLYSGRTGERIWRVTTWSAPSDVVVVFDTAKRNGLPDVDGDGVGDLYVDDPRYLDDQTVVHDVSIISGKDASVLRRMRAVGAFGLPANAGDLDGDGRDEIAMLGGDVNDLWLTLHDGASGDARWSRRVLSLPSGGYAEAIPSLKLDKLARPDGAVLAVNLHLDVWRTYTFLGFCFGCDEGTAVAEESIGIYRVIQPQWLALDGGRGDLRWALPHLIDADSFATTLGDTPGVTEFAKLEELTHPIGLLSTAARGSAPFAAPVIAGSVLAYGFVLAGGVAILRFRTRFEGVPDLE